MWPEVVNEVLHHIHLVWRDIVERNCTITAAGHAFFHRVIDVLLYQKSSGIWPAIKWCSGTKGKNLPRPRESLESPALTPKFSIHFPISTSSAPPPSDRHIIPVLSLIPLVANLLTASLERT